MTDAELIEIARTSARLRTFMPGEYKCTNHEKLLVISHDMQCRLPADRSHRPRHGKFMAYLKRLKRLHQRHCVRSRHLKFDLSWRYIKRKSKLNSCFFLNRTQANFGEHPHCSCDTCF